MAALQCEICGGKLIGKPGGVFECDSCGMEYSTEWAKAKVQEIKGTVKIEGPVEVTGTVKVEGGGASAKSLLNRAQLALEDEDWDKARELLDQVLSMEPENAEAYLGLVMADEKCSTWETFADWYIDGCIDLEDKNLNRGRQFAEPEWKAWLEELEQRRISAYQQNAVRLAPMRKGLALAAGLISAGDSHTVGLLADGTAMAVGDNDEDQCEVDGWTDLVAVSAGGWHTVGLRANGTAVAVGSNEYGRCEVGGWTDLVAISAGGYHTVGLRADGTAVAVGDNEYGQCDVSDWTGLVAVSAGAAHTVGLRADGTAVAVGNNEDGRCEVDDWTDLVAVSAGDYHTVGLMAGGTAVAVGDNEDGQCEVGGWPNLVAVSAGGWHTVALREDGTAVAFGDMDRGYCEIHGWANLVAVSANTRHTVGLLADGTLFAVGENPEDDEDEMLYCAIGDWKLFNSFNTLEQERREAAERRRKIFALEAEKKYIEAKLPTLQGLFSGGERRKLEARLAQIEEELSAL